MKTLTNDDLKAAMPHLGFEFYHFQFYARLIQGDGPTLHVGLSQAVGYEFLIHLRTLLDFFYIPGKGDDIFAAQFSGTTGLPVGNTVPAWVNDLKIQVNKRLAHITAERWKNPAPDMDYYLRCVPDINDLISTFAKALPPDLQNLLKARMDGYASRDADLFSQ